MASVSALFMASCQNDWTETGLTASVEKTTPKQALISFTTALPNKIAEGNYETGILYSTDKEIKPGSAMEDRAASGASSIVLKHLECGTSYYYRLYVKQNGEYYLSNTMAFTTKPLPKNAVDLGLSNDLLWADRNLGAVNTTGYGGNYAWGEVEPRTHFSVENYKFYIHGYTPMDISKYTIPDGQIKNLWYDENGIFIGDGKSVLEPEDDAVHVSWGGNWRIPSPEEFEILNTECSLVCSNDIKGMFFNANNSSSIFLPYVPPVEMELADDMVPNRTDYWTNSLWDVRTAWGGNPRSVGAFTYALYDLNPKECGISAVARWCAGPIRGVYDCNIEME